MQRDSRYGERTTRSIPHEGPNQRNLENNRAESVTMDRPSADAVTVGPSLTPPARQTKLAPPVRPFPARPAGRPCDAVSPVPA